MSRALPILLLFTLLLSACAVNNSMWSFTPEQAVSQSISRANRPGVVVDPSSIKVLQRVNVGGKTFVVLTSSQRVEGRVEQCTWLYEVRQSAFGSWESGSGGGGCSEQVAGNEAQPLEVGGGSQSDGSTDPGVCYAYGQVNQKDIVKVRVTWKDQMVQEVPVVNASYVSIRAGNIGFDRIEGLNEKGDVVFQHQDPGAAPGKQ